MSKKVKFFCTRCRRLVMYPENMTGSVVNCPHCNQSLIIPDIQSPEWAKEFSSQDGPRPPESVPNTVLEDTLTPDILSEKIESGSWEKAEPVSELTTDSLNNESGIFVPPIASSGVEIQAPPVIGGDSFVPDPSDIPVSKGRVLKIFGMIFFVLFIIAAGILAFVFLQSDFVKKNNSPDQQKETAVSEKKIILVDGRITNIGDHEKEQEEAGSFIFMFPEKFDKSSPLTTTGLTINNTHPVDYKKFKKNIESRGGLFMISDSSGTFDGKLTVGGKYRILIVSSKVMQKKGENHTAEFEQIGKYLYNPSDPLLRDYAFIWIEKTIDESHNLIEHNFGRVSGEILVQ